MTNEAIAAILDHLCNEARNAAHATFGVMELLRDVAVDSTRQASMEIGTVSADQLLRSIDDVRNLLSTVPASSTVEEFDVALCLGEIVEVLNLASGRRAKHMLLEAPSAAMPVTQDRKAVEQIFTRVLNTAFKLAHTSEVYVKIGPREDSGVRLTVTARDTDLAVCLNIWLNANPDQVVLQEPVDVPFVVAVMVAGKHLRAMGGSSELVRDSAGHSAIALDLPSQTPSIGDTEQTDSYREARTDALNVLVAEDCDDSFALSELLLANEHVWRARDGWEAIRIVQKQRFDVVLMDIHMPGMDGYSTIRSIRDWETETGNARIPVVILSSDDLETQQRSAAQCGCSGFLRKPIRRDDLTNLLDRLKDARRPAA